MRGTVSVKHLFCVGRPLSQCEVVRFSGESSHVSNRWPSKSAKQVS